MGWFVDGVDLSEYAWNVRNRSAGWKTSARRGENLTVPGRHGRIWNPNKPIDEGYLPLSMYVVGAEADGTFPTDISRQQQCRDNLDKLTGLFGQSGKLMDVVRSEDDQPVLINHLRNPSGEGDTFPQVANQNLVPNPSFSGVNSLGEPVSVAINRIDNPGAANTYRTAAHAVPGVQPIIQTSSEQAHDSLRSFKPQLDVGQTSTSLGIRILGYLPGWVYTFSCWVFVPTSVTQTIQDFRIAYGNLTNANLAVRHTANGTITKGAWSRVWVTAEMAEDSLYVFFYVRFTTDLPAGTAIYIDDVVVSRGARLRDYFSGNSDPVGPYTFRFSGEHQKSNSHMEGILPAGWGRDQCHLVADTAQTIDGSWSGLVIAHDNTVLSGVLPDCGIYADCPVLGGETVSARAEVKWANGTARACRIRLESLSETGAVLNAVNGVTQTPTTLAWSTLLNENFAVHADATMVRVHVQALNPSMVDGDEFWVENVLVRPGVTAGNFFFGGSTETTRRSYMWSDESWNSTSEEVFNVPEGWTTNDDSVGLFQDSAWSVQDDHSLVLSAETGLDCVALPTLGPGPDGYFRIWPGMYSTAFLTVKALRACRVTLRIRQKAATEIQLADVASTFLDMADQQVAELRIDNAQTSQIARWHSIEIEVTQTGGDLAPNWTGDSIAFDQAMLTRSEQPISPAAAYHDGDSDHAYWVGEPHRSYSFHGGTARWCKAECVGAIDVESMAGGTRAEFVAELTVPDGFWEEVVPRTRVLAFNRVDKIYSLNEWAGSTAPLDDFLIVIAGPVRTPRLRDIGSDSWVRYDGRLRSGETLTLDCKNFTATREDGSSVIGKIVRRGSSAMLPLTPEGANYQPRLRLYADAVGGGATVTITGRRKFLIA